MWSVPFNLNIHDSYFAVGMIFNRGRFASSSYWFNQMYYSEKGPYKRGRGGQSITFENSAVLVHGYMEASTYHPILNISVIPQVRYKLAPAIWRQLYSIDRARYTGGAIRTGTQDRIVLTAISLVLSHFIAQPLSRGPLVPLLILAVSATASCLSASFHW